MNKSLSIACLVCALGMSSFAQSAPGKTPADVGAQRVAERDAAWQKAHPGGMMANESVAHHKAVPIKHHVKVKHHIKAKHSKNVKHAKHKAKKAL